MTITLTHTSLFAQDIERMLKFYHDTLGLAVLEKRDGYAELKAGENVKLSFFNEQKAEHTIPLIQPSEFNDEHRTVIEFRVTQLDQFCNELRRQGVQFITEPTDYTDWGIRSAYITDPENNLINLYEKLGR